MNFVSRFCGWAMTSASVVAMSGTCPCCGKSMCPQGMALFGIIGGIVGCALRFVYRPVASNSEREPEAPKVWARHDLSLDFAARNSGDA